MWCVKPCCSMSAGIRLPVSTCRNEPTGSPKQRLSAGVEINLSGMEPGSPNVDEKSQSRSEIDRNLWGTNPTNMQFGLPWYLRAKTDSCGRRKLNPASPAYGVPKKA